MADSSNVLTEAKNLIETRLAEIKEEQTRLERALADLSGSRRGPGRPRGSRNSPSASTPTPAPAASPSGKRRRRRKGGTRAEQALVYITSNPGITASEVAAKLRIKPNYVYRVMSDLQEDLKVVKEGRGYRAI